MIDHSGPLWHLAPQPGARYSALRAAREAAHDQFTRLVGVWEHLVLAGLAHDPLLDRSGAEAYIEALWSRHASNWSPFFISAPALVIAEEMRTAECSWDQHQVIASPDMLRRSVLTHETAHLLSWFDVNHGAGFRDVLVNLWLHEFQIDAAQAQALAREVGLA